MADHDDEHPRPAPQANGRVEKAQWRRDHNREGVERQGRLIFWLTLATGLAILVIAGIYAIIL